MTIVRVHPIARIAAGAAVALVGLSVAAGPAVADPARVVRESRCEVDGAFTVCSSTDLVVHRQAIPAGLFQRVTNGTDSVTVSLDGTVIFSREAAVHHVTLETEQGFQVDLLLADVTRTSDGTVMCVRTHLLEVSEEIVIDRIDLDAC